MKWKNYFIFIRRRKVWSAVVSATIGHTDFDVNKSTKSNGKPTTTTLPWQNRSFICRRHFMGRTAAVATQRNDGRHRPPIDSGLRLRLHLVVARSAAGGQTSSGITRVNGSTGFFFFFVISLCCFIYIRQRRDEKKKKYTRYRPSTPMSYIARTIEETIF